MNFCFYFEHLLSHLSEIPCKDLNMMLLIIYEFCENLHMEGCIVHRMSKKLLLHMHHETV
jgi:hypothetical protein